EMPSTYAVVAALVRKHPHAFMPCGVAVGTLHGKIVGAMVGDYGSIRTFWSPATFSAPFVEYAVRSLLLAAEDVSYRKSFAARGWVNWQFELLPLLSGLSHSDITDPVRELFSLAGQV